MYLHEPVANNLAQASQNMTQYVVNNASNVSVSKFVTSWFIAGIILGMVSANKRCLFHIHSMIHGLVAVYHIKATTER